MPNQHQKYLRDEIQNASPQKLIILLYDGAIKALEDSKSLIEDKDPFQFTQKITKAQSIIAELIGALKVDLFPELVINLSKLYEYMYQQLVKANLEKSSEKIDQVIELMRGLRESWSTAIEKAEEEGFSLESKTKEDKENTSPKKPSLSFQA